MWLVCMPSPLLACTFRLHSCRGNMLQHPPCCCCGSVPCPSPLFGAVTCHDIAPMTPYAQGIVLLCIASELALLLCINVPHPSLSLGAAPAMALCSWLTKSSHCTRHCALVPPYYCPRSLMRPRCRPMKP